MSGTAGACLRIRWARPARQGIALLATGLALAACNTGTTAAPVTVQQAPPPARMAPLPVLTTPGVGRHDFALPLAVGVQSGTLTAAVVTGPQGVVAGTVSPTGWTSTGALAPAAEYRVAAQVRDLAGTERPLSLTRQTTAATRSLSALLSPGDDAVVGVGTPLTVLLSRPVTGHADRLAVLDRLTVTTAPASAGSWRFMSSTEIHYRPAAFWQPGTQITLTSDLSDLQLADRVTWGKVGAHTTRFRIGGSLVSTVDLTAYTMTVRQSGRVLRVMKMSAGSPKYPTKGGVHLVLAKVRLQLFDSATVGIARSSPDGSYNRLPWAVRISNGGAFVHAQPATVASQGVRNVGHGCINLSPSDAAWFYGLTRTGDVVDVVNAVVPPVLEDPGMSDWNIGYDQWADPVAEDLLAAPGRLAAR